MYVQRTSPPPAFAVRRPSSVEPPSRRQRATASRRLVTRGPFASVAASESPLFLCGKRARNPDGWRFIALAEPVRSRVSKARLMLWPRPKSSEFHHLGHREADVIASVPMEILTLVGRFWHSPIWNAHARSARAAGPGSRAPYPWHVHS